MKATRTTIRLDGETYFGVDIGPEGRLIVAERASGKPAAVTEYPAGDQGASALRRHIEQEHAHPHVCIRSCGAAALGLATALIPVPGIDVTLVSPAAMEAQADIQPAERAVRLARLAERL
jgi:hypothetical protein